MEVRSPGVVRLVVMASGSGSNLQAVLDACTEGCLPAQVVAVISDVADAGALRRASVAGVPAQLVERSPGETRRSYDQRLAETVAAHEPHWVVLAGFMRLLSSDFLDRFPGRVVNLHPALPGQLPGLHAIERAHAEAGAEGRTHTGVMVHLVPDEGVDDGPVLATATVPIHPTDSLDDLRDRVHAAEHRLLVSTLRQLCLQGAHP
jgi:formyltetrahydrofolate-dependent phosphoribosylglycinamide formyltransferase